MRSIKDLENIIKFNSLHYGRKKAVEFATALRESTEILASSNFKELGSVDEDFLKLNREYRKLFYKHYKITYREGKSYIYINKIFDTRRNPSKNI